MTKSTSRDKDDELSFLQRCFGVDRWCTIYDEDEGFKLLADLSLCMYFGCGKSKDVEVPRVVSVTNSEDHDASDSLSDVCDEHHGGQGSELPSEDESPERIWKPDPPQCSSKPFTISLVHPPPPPPPPKLSPSLIDSPSATSMYFNTDECSRITAHYESREALDDSDLENMCLDDSDEENIPPVSTIVVGRRRKTKEISSDLLDNVPPIILGKTKCEVIVPEPEDDFSMEEYPADEYPTVVYSQDRLSRRRRCAYV